MSEQKQEEKQRKPKAQKYKVLKNIKHNKTCYRIGEEIDLDSKDEAEKMIKDGLIIGG